MGRSSKASEPREQLYLDGTEPVRDPEIDEAIAAWRKSLLDRKDIAETVKIRHSTLLIRMADKGIERYPFLNEEGKRKMVVANRETKIKVSRDTTTKKKSKKKRGEREEDDAPEATGETPASPPQHSDPFGQTRRELESRT